MRISDWSSDVCSSDLVDEAHFIKNKKSQRSQHVLDISDHIQHRVARPLLMALTGTPLINDIEDFVAIWEFLGWIDAKKPGPVLMGKLEETGRSEEHTSELQSLMRISYAVFCLKKKTQPPSPILTTSPNTYR